MNNNNLKLDESLGNCKRLLRQIMKSIMIKFLTMVFILFCFTELSAQKISRSTGIGNRVGVWKMYDPTGGVDVGTTRVKSTTGSGMGGLLYFFTRLRERWFLETSFGNLGSISVTKIGDKGIFSSTSDINLWQFGTRYDWLSPKYGSAYQPYVSFGGGLYWLNESGTIVRSGQVESLTGTTIKTGVFGGGGLNVLLSSWFSLNAVINFHFMDFDLSHKTDGVEYGVGFHFMWGGRPEIFRVEDVQVIVEDIYPAYYQFYSDYPIAQVKIKNTASYPIEVNVHSNIKDYSVREMESGFVRINRGEEKYIPIKAIFDPKILYASKREPAVIDIKIEARTGSKQTKSMSVEVMIHSRNAWNGEVERLRYFVTPDDEEVVKLSRELIENLSGEEMGNVENFEIAKQIFNALKTMGITYQSDPNIPYYQDDYVKYANETKMQGTGDCDDLVVLYNSLLESVGIKTAFVQVQDPDKELAHLYMIFDSGLEPEYGQSISTNEKRFIIREKGSGKKTIWIPVETTLVREGFEEAWKAAASSYLEDGNVRNGLVEGWINIIDVN